MISIDLWLYGPLAKYGGSANRGSHANLTLEFPDNSTMQQLMDRLDLPADEKGITFINRQLSDMPGLAADRNHELHDGDRVAIFHTKSMWPFQYRHDVAASPELKEAMRLRDGGLHHSYD
ncbi:MAG: MoaD/ThiS family protein [Anaerolineales bacterium]|nr:MoaD/ThiS family protein [Anaerolineales bacterium]